MSLSENQEQILVIKWFNEHCGEFGLPEIALAHVCNEQPSASRRALNKQLGVRNGFPDLILTVPRGQYHGLFIELKRTEIYSKKNPVAGMSDSQKSFKDYLTSQGYLSMVCYGAEHAIQTIKIYLNRNK